MDVESTQSLERDAEGRCCSPQHQGRQDIGAKAGVSRPRSVTYVRSPSWAAFSDGLGTPTSVSRDAVCAAASPSLFLSPIKTSSRDDVYQDISPRTPPTLAEESGTIASPSAITSDDTDSTTGFRIAPFTPRQLLLSDANHTLEQHPRASRSRSVPLLSLEQSQHAKMASQKRAKRVTYEPSRRHASTDTACSRSTASMWGTDASKDRRQLNVSVATDSPKADCSVSRRQSPECIQQPTSTSHTDYLFFESQDEDQQHMSTSTAGCTASALPPADLASQNTLQKDRLSSGANTSLQRPSMSAFSATMDTESSSSMELVSWHVHTGSDEQSHFEGIFCPPSTAQSDQKNVPLPGLFDGTLGRDEAKHSLTFQLSSTQLHNGSDSEMNTAWPRTAELPSRTPAAFRDFSFPMPPSATRADRMSYSARCGHSVPERCTFDAHKLTHLRDSHCADFSKVLYRGWYPLESLRMDESSPQRHRRSTLDSGTIQPRITTVCHRSIKSHPQLAVKAPMIGLGPVSEHPVRSYGQSRPRHRPVALAYGLSRESRILALMGNPLDWVTKRKGTHLMILLELGLVLHQVLFCTFDAPYLWQAISPILPLTAAALLLMLDIFLLQLYLRVSVPLTLLIYFGMMLASTMACCIAMTTSKIVLLQQDELESDTSGFQEDRAEDMDAFEHTIRHTHVSVMLVVLELFGILVGAALIVVSSLEMRTRRKRSA